MLDSGSPTAPSAGEVSGAVIDSGAANSSALDYSTTSDDQILDNEGTDTAGEASPAGDDDLVSLDGEGSEAGDEQDQGQAVAQDGQPPEAPKTEEAELQLKDPTAYRQVFRAHPELRNLYYRDRAIAETFPGGVNEMRQYKEALPSLEDVQSVIEARDNLAELDGLYYSDDPSQFIERLAGEDAQAFGRLAASFPNALYNLNPEAYREHIAQPVIQSALSNLYNLALSRGDDGENLMNAVEVISMNLLGKRFSETQRQGAGLRDPRELELQRREQTLNQREQQAQQQQFQQFHSATNEAAVTGVIGAIKAVVQGDPKAKMAGLLKGSAFEGNEKAQNKIIGEIYTAIDGALKANKGFVSQLQAEMRAAQRTGNYREAQQRIAQLSVQRAKQILPAIAKRVMGEYTELAVGQNRQRLQNMQRTQSRVDVTGAAGGPGSPGRAVPRVVPQNVNYGKTSDDDILEGRVYVRKR